jgi:8-amino-7-oxononanoate synthase
LNGVLEAALAARRAAGLYRARALADAPATPTRVVDGRARVSFASNDYLGLAADPRVRAAFVAGAERYGVGAGAAHLLGGHTAAHEALEEALAAHVGRPRALLFSTGYMANLGILQALLGRGDVIYTDRLNHASLLDAAALSRARHLRYRHVDVGHLAQRLAGAPTGRRALIATDAVFSMDGDLAPLPALAGLAARHGAWLLADDAHGLGVLGPCGGGSAEHFGLGPDRLAVLMGTLGKALGTFGAFVAGGEALIETLIQHARSYVYTTAPPPALACATLAALRLAREEHWRRAHLADLVARFRAGAAQLGWRLADSATPIQPILVGAVDRTLAVAARLEAAGFYVPAIRPPTVPAGGARLRVSLSAAHTPAQVDALLDALGAAR